MKINDDSIHTEATLRCDVLLLFATSTEKDMLKKAALDMGLTFRKIKTEWPFPDRESFYLLGKAGNNRVNAMQTTMGPMSYGGSASRAIYGRIATEATAIIQLGMAFGVDPQIQEIGDVLVATSLIPYDRRIIRPASAVSVVNPLDMPESDSGSVSFFQPGADDDEYVVDYSPASRHRAKEFLVKMFESEDADGAHKHQVFFGGMLTGGAQICSRKFVKELVNGVPQADDVIVGGEMEGVGLLSVSPENDPAWGVVKGISDFADANRNHTIEQTRPIACENAARFVLSALMNS